MAMMGGYNRQGRGSRRRAAPMSEINVTPLVDVMLVLLIVFMISASVLVSGVNIELPKTDAKALPTQSDPLTISVDRDGRVFIMDSEVSLDSLVPRLTAIAQNGYDERIYLRGDEGADYGNVMKVMARINSAGFSNLNLVTDPVDR
ncbi:ExbD/TolR family protein [Robiginitomaculum antarcticum]|uniref:ExbD/TolR family protein n=1 Tax=Robiginitomaculum antarcticum TaxID=437507 RepID=UPI00035C1EDA|nr:biopolymer transporter ExbD [Robiginitomaculum antarcticum]